MKYKELKEKLQMLRTEILSQIRLLLPTEQKYVDIHLGQGIAGIKWLMPDGDIGHYEPFKNQITYYNIGELPTDALLELLKELQRRFSDL